MRVTRVGVVIKDFLGEKTPEVVAIRGAAKHVLAVGTAGAEALKWEWAKAGERVGGRRQADQCGRKVPVALGTLRVGVEERWDSDVL